MHSPDLTAAHIARIRELFPGCVTETRDAGGKVTLAVDFDLLRQELSPALVDGPQERYHLNWPGKRAALLAANAPIAKTLRPCREESVEFDTTQNLFIEGDNLDALKLLQETYLGKVKMIYIDPPYNTGKDFIYKDNFAEDTQSYLQRSGQREENGGRLVANTESNGRYHSDWLSMMYPRLRLARNLLRDDGVIFISINHKELANIRKISDEVFGEENMLCVFAWRSDGNFDNQAKFKYCHEYIVAYAKQEPNFPHPLTVDPSIPKDSKIFRDEIRNTIVKNGPKNPQSEIFLPDGFPASFDTGVIVARDNSWPNLRDTAHVKDGKLVRSARLYSGWSSKELLEEFIKNNCQSVFDSKGQETSFELTASGAIEAIKVRGEPSHVISVLTGFGGPQKATAKLSEINIPFDDYPKPVELIKYLASMVNERNFIAVDFFAGSATTAHAVMQLNAEDGGNRKFIMVQLPEPCPENSEARKAGYKTIAEISKERIRRAGAKIAQSAISNQQSAISNQQSAISNQHYTLDIGFRALKIDTTNMADVYYSPDAIAQTSFEKFVDNIKSDRSDEDLLFQVMLDWGIDLTLPIIQKTIQNKIVFFVDNKALIACFDKEQGIDEALVKELAAYQPARVVFRDAGFKNDDVKINVEQIFKQLSPVTDVKCL